MRRPTATSARSSRRRAHRSPSAARRSSRRHEHRRLHELRGQEPRPADPGGAARRAKCKTMLPWLVDADTASFEAEANASVPVVVDLWAPWCGPCRMIAPILSALAAEHAGRLKVVKVNVDEEPALGRRFDARSIPLLVIMRDGREAARIVGAVPRPVIESRLGL